MQLFRPSSLHGRVARRAAVGLEQLAVVGAAENAQLAPHRQVNHFAAVVLEAALGQRVVRLAAGQVRQVPRLAKTGRRKK